MLKYILKRVLLMIPVLMCVTIVVFSLMYAIPGDPVDIVLQGADATEEEREAVREDLGIQGTYFERLGKYALGLLHGDFGKDYLTRTPVAKLIAERLPNTLKLAGWAILFGTIFGLIFGVVAAVKQYTFVDNFMSVLALFGIATPVFWLALLMMLLFSVKLEWLPATGFDSWKSMIMPVICSSFSTIGSVARMTRSSMLEVIRSDYITTARAKGLKESVLIIKHGLANAMLPVITTIGMRFGVLLGGSVIVEQVFAINGIGTLIVSAVNSRNYPVVQGGVLVFAFCLCLLNLIVDLLYAIIDPRLKAQYK